LVVADVAASYTALKFLLLPPFGALAYLVFVNPAAVPLNVRRIVLCPTLTALLAWTLAATLGYSVLSIVVGTGGTIAIMWLLNAQTIVPALALELLSLLLHDQIRHRPGYVVSVFVFTVALYALYRLWLHLPAESASESSRDSPSARGAS
jgi:hypothetical protein